MILLFQDPSSWNNCLHLAVRGTNYTLIFLISFSVLELWLENFTNSYKLIDNPVFSKIRIMQHTKYHAKIVIFTTCHTQRQRSTLTASQLLIPLMPSGAFNICCPRDCVLRHNGGASGAPLKPLRVDSALKLHGWCNYAKTYYYY